MRWKLSYLLFLGYIGLAKADAMFRTDYTYDKEAGGWLKLHRMPVTFQEAFLNCNLEGAVLASPLSENLHNAMMKAIEASRVDCAVFTGIHATIAKGYFTSIEGVPIEKIPLEWAANEPDNYGNEEDCIVMLQQNGTAADVRCNDTFPYICYKDKPTNRVNMDCGTIDSEYKLYPRTGSCYKFHRNTKNWKRAQMTCLAEGGYLAIINSHTEMQVLKDLFADIPRNSIKSEHQENAALGFLDWDKAGSWFTVHGQSLEDAGYSSWGSGQPNEPVDETKPQYCGSMFSDGTLDNYWCEFRPLAFICEKSPDSIFPVVEH